MVAIVTAYMQLDMFAQCVNKRKLFELTGDSPGNRRAGIIEKMNEAERAITVCTYGVAGVALNLQTFNALFLADYLWNPNVCRVLPHTTIAKQELPVQQREPLVLCTKPLVPVTSAGFSRNHWSSPYFIGYLLVTSCLTA